MTAGSQMYGKYITATLGWSKCKPPRISASLNWSFRGYETTFAEVPTLEVTFK